MDMRKWFKEAQYGMMVHWGLYSLLAGEYKDRYSGVYAEWIQANLAIPNAEYGKLAKAFNPVFFDAEEWVKLAKDCGMKYFVVTSKHHDGFAMFHSKVDKYNVVDATPFGRDVIGEIAEACCKLVSVIDRGGGLPVHRHSVASVFLPPHGRDRYAVQAGAWRLRRVFSRQHQGHTGTGPLQRRRGAGRRGRPPL